MGKVALITGVTGQDGAYLAELLLSKGYTMHGIKRRSSSFNTGRIDHLYQDPHEPDPRFVLHYGDMTDATNLIRIVQEVQPGRDLQSRRAEPRAGELRDARIHRQCRRLGTLRLLEAIRILGLEGKTRFYQASTSELYGMVQEVPQRETTPFYPRSPYAAAKLYAYWITVNYREAYGIHASNGILFNHESPVRGETFVTRKITRAVAAIHLGLQDWLISATSTRSATGATRATTSRACGACAAGHGRRLRPRDRRDPHGAQLRREVVRPDRPRSIVWRGTGVDGGRALRRQPGASTSRSTRATSGRPRSTS